jgi:outer membrane protein TolC
LEIARQRLKVSRSLYPLGRVTAQQLRDAEEAWVQADREELEARLRQTEEVFALWYTLGRMLESAGESEAAIGD